MNAKVRIVRGWLILAACVIAVLLWPDWRLLIGVPLFFWAGCPCCGTANCEICDASDSIFSFAVTFASIADGSCSNCDTALNGTYTFDVEDEFIVAECYFGNTGFPIPAPCTHSLDVNSSWSGVVAGNVTVIVQFSDTNSGVVQFSATFGVPIDCTSYGPQAMTRTSDTTGACDYSAATATFSLV